MRGKPGPGASGAMRRALVGMVSHSLCILFTLTSPALIQVWLHTSRRHSICKYYMEGRMKSGRRKNEIKGGKEKLGVHCYWMLAVSWGGRDKNSVGCKLQSKVRTFTSL